MSKTIGNMKGMKHTKRFLRKNPCMKGINGRFNYKFLDTMAGKKDANANQICECEGGHITPHILDKLHLYESYINKVYLHTVLDLEPLSTQAKAYVAEYNLISGKSNIARNTQENTEEAQRKIAQDKVITKKAERRQVEILTALVKIKSISEMIDESLIHHIERADGIFKSRISLYWKGVKAMSSEPLAYFPSVEIKEHTGRETYEENSRKLMQIIESVIQGGELLYESKE